MQALLVAALLLTIPSCAGETSSTEEAPDAPGNVDAERIAEKALVTWETVQGAAFYNIYEAGNLIGTAVEPAFTHATPPEIGIYTVTAAIGDVESAPSQPAFLGPACVDVGDPFPYVWLNVESCLELIPVEP